MITSKQCKTKYGVPDIKNSCLTTWEVPEFILLATKVLPKKIYNVNNDIIQPIELAFKNLIERELIAELKTFDGFFYIREKKGNTTPSLHSWAVAVDFNAKDNVYGLNVEQLKAKQLTPFSDEFLQCFRDAGFDAGGDWKKQDRMHFQLSKLP